MMMMMVAASQAPKDAPVFPIQLQFWVLPALRKMYNVHAYCKWNSLDLFTAIQFYKLTLSTELSDSTAPVHRSPKNCMAFSLRLLTYFASAMQRQDCPRQMPWPPQAYAAGVWCRAQILQLGGKDFFQIKNSSSILYYKGRVSAVTVLGK